MEDENELDFVATEHDQLISAISKLDKTQHISAPTRNEPTPLNTEFNLIKRSNKIKLSSVVKVLKDTAYHVKIGQKLKNSHNNANVLQTSLEKPQAERVKRATGYEQVKTKIGRWDPVVARNRTVDFVSFPLNQVSSKLQSTGEFLSKLKLKSSLEKELEEIDPPPPEVESEEETNYPMSYEEMLKHRQNSAKIRAQQSYNAAKAKRQSKIKSKKYHRILKKEKMKQQLKEFEELQIKNPEEALKKLEEIEKARALERHTLRHKNTGKWAKSKLVQAKYNKEVREQLAEQLSVSKSLTQKVQAVESTDDEDENGELITDTTLAQDPMNTWMMKNAGKSNIDTEFDFGYKKYLKDKMFKRKTDSDSESDDESPTKTNEEAAVAFNALNKSIKKLSSLDSDKIITENPIKVRKVQKSSGQKKAKSIQAISTSSWHVDDTVNSNQLTDTDKNINDINTAFEKFETNVVNKVENKLKMLKKQLDEQNSRNENNTDHKKVKKDLDNLEYLKLKRKEKAIIDEELIETYSGEPRNLIDKEENIIKILNQPKQTKTQENSNVEVNPNKLLGVKPKFLNSTLPNNVNDLDDLDDEQVVPKVDIEKVFEEDDIVTSFRQEKEDEINKDKEQEVVSTLPGWGSWGGKGVKAPKRKRNRFISKLAPKMPRRDENKGDIIINEYKDAKLAIHKVTDLPFLFTSVKDFEASIRTPLGNTFIPEKAHKKLIRPNIITKAGAIIEPMEEEALLVRRNQTFKNEDILKLLAKK